MDKHTQTTQKLCTGLINAFAYYVDHRQFQSAVELFSEDGIFERPEGVFKGQAEIMSLFEKRPENVVTRHLLTQPYFTSISADTAHSVTQCTLYHATAEKGHVARVTQPVGIAEFIDSFTLTSEGWKIRERRGVPIFMYQSS